MRGFSRSGLCGLTMITGALLAYGCGQTPEDPQAEAERLEQQAIPCPDGQVAELLCLDPNDPAYPLEPGQSPTEPGDCQWVCVDIVDDCPPGFDGILTCEEPHPNCTDPLDQCVIQCFPADPCMPGFHEEIQCNGQPGPQDGDATSPPQECESVCVPDDCEPHQCPAGFHEELVCDPTHPYDPNDPNDPNTDPNQEPYPGDPQDCYVDCVPDHPCDDNGGGANCPPPGCDPADPNCPEPPPCDPADPNCPPPPPPPPCDPAMDPNCPPPPPPGCDPADPNCPPQPCDPASDPNCQ